MTDDFTIEWWRKPDGTVTSPAQEEIERLLGILQFHETASKHEIAGLQAENERLRSEMRQIEADAETYRQQFEAKSADVERLEAALREITEVFKGGRHIGWQDEINRIYDIARAALEGK